jgi:DNA-binding FadR family transcriptional regulator
VVTKLLEHLRNKRVPPGTRLPSERQLAATLKVGRSAIREALAALDLLGLVVIRPGSGTYVQDTVSELLPQTVEWGLMLGVKDIHDLVEVRQCLETMSAKLAAERAGDDEIAAIGAKLDQMRRSADDPPAYATADVAFHLQIADVAKNSVLGSTLHSIRALLQVWVARTSTDQPEAEASLAEHVAIFEAIAARDPAAAEKAMQSHMLIAADRLKDSLSRDQALSPGE